MIQRVSLNGIKLPRLYIAENGEDVAMAQANGIPYIKWNQGQDALIKQLLRPTLEELFPHIMWDKVLGTKKKFRTMVNIVEPDADPITCVAPHDNIYMEDEDGTHMETSSISTNERLFRNSEANEDTYVERLPIEEYAGDLTSCVNIDVLQRLRLMPQFIGDILDCVKTNIGSGMYWREGYNKRRALPVGRYDAARQRPNLIILDVSGSIPRGISATMITLIDTLRTQLSADLIITSSISKFYPMGSELPSPQEIRNNFGYGNESWGFFDVLSRFIRGKHYGHVFSFGDADTPDYTIFNNKYDPDWCLAGTQVDFVHHYHTGKWYSHFDEKQTGYAKWCHHLGNEPESEFDTSWCKVIRKD